MLMIDAFFTSSTWSYGGPYSYLSFSTPIGTITLIKCFSELKIAPINKNSAPAKTEPEMYYT